CNFLLQVSIYFFFSSRRRHTRFSRDWSSDVCSSDLIRCFFSTRTERALWQPARRSVLLEQTCERGSWPTPYRKKPSRQHYQRARSEERRVGKECRTGWER